MSKRRRSRHRSPGFGPFLHRQFRALRRHGLQIVILGAFSLALTWLVLCKSLPYAVGPDLALKLNPNNPKALLAKAQQARAQLVQLNKAKTGGKTDNATVLPDGVMKDTIEALPSAADGASDLDPVASERERLQGQIVAYANRVLANDPLNAEAMRLLAEQTSALDERRMLMLEAVKRSRREAYAMMWLLQDSFAAKDYPAAIDWADMVLRTAPELNPAVYHYLAQMAETPEALPVLVQHLSRARSWQQSFLMALPRYSKRSDTPLLLFAALKELGWQSSDKEVKPYLEFLIANNRIDQAYDAWLQFLSHEDASETGLLLHKNFEAAPSGVPFDWQLQAGMNAIAEFVSVAGTHALHIRFNGSSVTFPELSQYVVLSPGHYRFEGQIRGHMQAKRGLRWQLRCAGAGGMKVLAQTDMLTGHAQDWRVFAFDVEVPEGGDCIGQKLRLFHDARSASEQFIDGDIWFTGLDLKKTLDGKTADANLGKTISDP